MKKSIFTLSILFFMQLGFCQVKSDFDLSKQQFPNKYQLINNDILKNNTSESYEKSLPFFCKMEHKIEKSSGIAFRFRVGSLDYVNKLEGK